MKNNTKKCESEHAFTMKWWRKNALCVGNENRQS